MKEEQKMHGMFGSLSLREEGVVNDIVTMILRGYCGTATTSQSLLLKYELLNEVSHL